MFQTDEQEVITFLLTTEIIPLCLRIMESGSELSKTVATFILQKILLDDSGLNYICQTYDRFSHVAMILVSVIIFLVFIFIYSKVHVIPTFISSLPQAFKENSSEIVVFTLQETLSLKQTFFVCKLKNLFLFF